MEYPQEPGRGPTRLLILSVVAVVAVAALLVLHVVREENRGAALRGQALVEPFPSPSPSPQARTLPPEENVSEISLASASPNFPVAFLNSGDSATEITTQQEGAAGEEIAVDGERSAAATVERGAGITLNGRDLGRVVVTVRPGQAPRFTFRDRDNREIPPRPNAQPVDRYDLRIRGTRVDVVQVEHDAAGNPARLVFAVGVRGPDGKIIPGRIRELLRLPLQLLVSV